MDNAVLKIQHLEKKFSGFKLGPLYLTVPRGAIYGLIGPNGAGKTTTMDLIMGMGSPDAGSITVFGLDHARDEVAVKKQIGYASPDLLFNAWGKVKRLIGFVRAYYADWDDAYCMQLMERLRIGWNDSIAHLSFGARTKLGLVVALSHHPALLLLDEPFAGLDASSKHEILAELMDAVQDENRTVLISSHDLHDLERFADHIGILHRGRLLLEGPTARLVESYRRVVGALSNPAALQLPGVYLQKRDGDQVQLLVNTAETALERLAEAGINDLSASPVTLEELLVGLVKEN